MSAIGKINITVIKANLTHDLCTFSTMDPQFIVYLQGINTSQAFRSKIKENAGKFPVWNETTTVEFSGQNSLYIDVMHDKELVGRAEIFTNEIVQKGSYSFEYALFKGVKVTGQVFVKIIYDSNLSNYSNPISNQNLNVDINKNNISGFSNSTNPSIDSKSGFTKTPGNNNGFNNPQITNNFSNNVSQGMIIPNINIDYNKNNHLYSFGENKNNQGTNNNGQYTQQNQMHNENNFNGNSGQGFYGNNGMQGQNSWSNMNQPTNDTYSRGSNFNNNSGSSVYSNNNVNYPNINTSESQTNFSGYNGFNQQTNNQFSNSNQIPTSNQFSNINTNQFSNTNTNQYPNNQFSNTTNPINTSNQFSNTITNEVPLTNGFSNTNTNQFSNSNTNTNQFSNLSQVPITNQFSNSNTNTNQFSNSNTNTSQFSNSSQVPNPNQFSNSNTNTNKFSNSSQVPNPNQFSNSNTNTNKFSNSSQVPNTNQFSNLSQVPITNQYSNSNTIKNQFSNSSQVPTTNQFSNTNQVPITNQFSNSNPVPITNQFSNINTAPITNQFSNLNQVPTTNHFSNTNTNMNSIPTMDQLTDHSSKGFNYNNTNNFLNSPYQNNLIGTQQTSGVYTNTLNYFKHPMFFQHNSKNIWYFDMNNLNWSQIQNSSQEFFYQYHRATEMPDGSYFLTGGDLNGQSINSARHFTNGKFLQKENMKGHRKAHSSVYMSNCIYVFGGFGSNGITKSCERFNFNKGSWECIADLNYKRAYSTPVVFGDSEIYIVGGFIGDDKLDGLVEVNIIEKYDSHQNKFIVFNLKLPYPVYGCISTFVSDSKLLIAGGWSEENGNSPKVYTINLSNGSIELLPDLQKPGWSIMPAYYLNNSLYAFSIGEETEATPDYFAFPLKTPL